jgi:hypothetical protein
MEATVFYGILKTASVFMACVMLGFLLAISTPTWVGITGVIGMCWLGMALTNPMMAGVLKGTGD